MLEWIIIAISATLILAFWPEIVDWCTRQLAPWIEQNLGILPAKLFRSTIAWLDAVAVLTTRVIREAWHFIGQRLFKLERRYERIATSHVRETTETIVMTDAGSALRRIEEQEIPWARLPNEIRSKMIRSPNELAAMDMRALLEEKFRDRAREESMELELKY